HQDEGHGEKRGQGEGSCLSGPVIGPSPPVTSQAARLVCEAIHTSMEVGARGDVTPVKVPCGQAGTIHKGRVGESWLCPQVGTCEWPTCACAARRDRGVGVSEIPDALPVLSTLSDAQVDV